MAKIGFDNEKYVMLQSERIRERIGKFGGKLYLEYGGKLFDDNHASRVLPGFKPDSKIKMLCEMRDEAEIIIAINANHIEKSKHRGDLGITYDDDTLRLIDNFRERGLYVGSVVITQFRDQPAAKLFKKKLERLGMKVYEHYVIPDYPSNIEFIVSDEGLGRNEYIETTRSLVVVTAPGPGSGKLATCLSQLYHESKRGNPAGYAKFETFPIWNLPLNHPVNIAYEAATADMNDMNAIDPFHLEAYGKTTVNYNRDIESFPVLCATFNKMLGYSPYKSPTDMGVNMAGYCISDDEAVCRAAKDEVNRRYFKAVCGCRKGLSEPEEVKRLELIMNKLGVAITDRKTVVAARAREEETGAPAAAIELDDGTVITGKTTNLLGASSAMLLNTLKYFAGIAKEITLISPTVIEPIQKLKVNCMGNRNPRLHMDEILIALAMCAATDERAAKALDQLPKLSGLDAHSSVMLALSDEKTFAKLGIYITSEPKSQTDRLFQN